MSAERAIENAKGAGGVLRPLARHRRARSFLLGLAALAVVACRRDASGSPVTSAPVVVDGGSATDSGPAAALPAPSDAGVDADADAGEGARVTGAKLREETRGGRTPVHMKIPRVTTTSPAADAAFAAAIERVVATEVKEFLASAREEANCTARDAPPGNCAMPIDCAVTLARGHGLSARCDATPYTGGAHPSKDVFSLNFVLDGDAVRPIRIDDLAVDAAAKRKLIKKALAALEARNGGGLSELIGTHVFTDRDLPFTIERGGRVRIIFTDLPFAVGPQDVRLDAAALKDLVRPEVLAAFE